MKKILLVVSIMASLLIPMTASAITVNGWITADNDVWIWNGLWNTTGANWNNWTQSDPITFNLNPGETKYLYFAVKNEYANLNTGNPAGLLGHLLASSGIFTETGTNKLITDTTHWDILSFPNGWSTAPLVDPTSLVSWVAPTSYGANNAGGNPWTQVSNIDPNALWIWTANNSGNWNCTDNFGILRTHVTAPAVPEPGTLMLLGTGLIGLVRLRRKK